MKKNSVAAPSDREVTASALRPRKKGILIIPGTVKYTNFINDIEKIHNQYQLQWFVTIYW